jgi:phenylacetate-CoA ligase
MRALDKILRRWQLLALERVDAAALQKASARRVVKQFRQVSRKVPAYAALLNERGISAERVRTLSDFTAICPVIEKSDVFGNHPIDQLCVGADLKPLAGVLTSSGQGGHFAFGLSTHRQAKRAAKAIELAMEYTFQTDSCPTLLINALPMGVRFPCSTVTIAETSVREDMVCALVEQFGPFHDQVVLVTDPLFCKRIIDHGRETGLDWGRFKIHVILGEETFGEAFRRYVASRLGQDPEGWTRGFVGSSMGVGELGLNLFFETRETVRLRQLADRRPEVMLKAIGDWPGRAPPLLFVYDPLRIFVEVVEPDQHGFGALTISTLEPSLMLPLLRYRTGDRARILDTAEVADALRVAGCDDMGLPGLPMIALAGREQEMLPDGRSLLDVKDGLYEEPTLADQLTGAFRIEPEKDGAELHVQTRAKWLGTREELAQGLADRIPIPSSGLRDRIEIWGHADFPFGKTNDYERKFTYYSHARSP